MIIRVSKKIIGLMLNSRWYMAIVWNSTFKNKGESNYARENYRFTIRFYGK